ncbi:hypothetical protein GCM10020258_14160 [Sphingomonas yabuuchiae]
MVYVTGSDEGRIAVAALKAGAADYVVKTVGEDFFDLLSASFAQVLDRARLERAKAAAEAELRATNARLEAMLSEVNHRVANSLQLVSAMIGLQKGVLTDPAPATCWRTPSVASARSRRCTGASIPPMTWNRSTCATIWVR